MTSRESGRVTFDAIEQMTEPAGSSLGSGDPNSHLPRRIVPDVLTVTALQIRDPVTLLVQVEAHNGTLHWCRGSRRPRPNLFGRQAEERGS